ncbi:hypothetical protein, partial [Anaerosporobacter sp.]
MDYTLDIIILKEEIKQIDLYEKKIEWGGESLSCDPPCYIGQKNIVFEQIRNEKYYDRIIGKKLEDNSIVLN